MIMPVVWPPGDFDAWMMIASSELAVATERKLAEKTESSLVEFASADITFELTGKGIAAAKVEVAAELEQTAVVDSGQHLALIGSAN